MVEQRLTAFLTDRSEVFDAIDGIIDAIDEQKRIIEQASVLAGRWQGLHPTNKKAMLQTIIHRVDVRRDKMMVHLKTGLLAEAVRPDHDPVGMPAAADGDTSILTLTIPACLQQSGLAKTLTIDSNAKQQPDRSLLRLLVLAARYRKLVMQGGGKTIKALAAEAGVSTSYTKPPRD